MKRPLGALASDLGFELADITPILQVPPTHAQEVVVHGLPTITILYSGRHPNDGDGDPRSIVYASGASLKRRTRRRGSRGGRRSPRVRVSVVRMASAVKDGDGRNPCTTTSRACVGGT